MKEELGLEIKIARLRKRLTQYELGLLIKEPSYNVSRYERGVVTPSPEVLERIGAVLDIDVSTARGASNGRA